jgi:branched-chain amino acid transport system substrate-binding protein
MFKRTFALIAVMLFWQSQALAAETGVSDQSIVLGQSIALSGALSDLGKEYSSGASLYFEHVNAQGGVYNRKIRLVSLDDGYDTQKAVENTKRLVEKDKVFAIFAQFGTGITLASLPLTTEAGIPLFAPYTGADSLRDNKNRYLFHIRASYGDETEKMVEQLASTGVRDIAVVHQNDPFGKAGLLVAEQAMQKRGLKPVAVGAIDISPNVEVRKAVDTVSKVHPAAIIMIAAGKGAVGFIKEFQKTGQTPQYYGLSVVSSRQLVKELGGSAHGIAISQVMPSPWRTSSPAAREYQSLVAKQKGFDITYTSFEGYMAAKAFVEGLKRAGRDLTREKFVTGLETMRNHDLGGLVIDFGPGRHSGSNYVDLSIISKDGQFLR